MLKPPFFSAFLAWLFCVRSRLRHVQPALASRPRTTAHPKPLQVGPRLGRVPEAVNRGGPNFLEVTILVVGKMLISLAQNMAFNRSFMGFDGLFVGI